MPTNIVVIDIRDFSLVANLYEEQAPGLEIKLYTVADIYDIPPALGIAKADAALISGMPKSKKRQNETVEDIRKIREKFPNVLIMIVSSWEDWLRCFEGIDGIICHDNKLTALKTLRDIILTKKGG